MKNAAAPIAKLTVPQRALYGMGNMGGNFLNLVFSMWVFKRYCPPEGEGTALIPIMWLSMALTAGRVVDAVADPLIGYWSDMTRTRFGRRIPFILFGGLPLCLVFFLIWAPPTGLFPPHSFALFAYICALMGLFWILFTATLCPYLALLPEIASTPEDRLNLATWQSIFLLGSSGVAMVGSPFIKDALGFVWLGVIFAVLSLAGVYAPLLAVKEPPCDASEAKSGDYDIVKALRWTFSNRAFAFYIFSNFFYQIGYNMLIMGMPYIVTVLLGKSDAWVGAIMGGTAVFAAVSFILLQKLIEKFDQKKVYLWSAAYMAVLIPAIWPLGHFDLSVSLAPLGVDLVVGEFAIGFVLFALAGFPVAALMVLPTTILSDIIDLDELQTGRRREAMYFGAQGLIQKGGIAISGLVMGTLFARFGYSKAAHSGIDLLGPAAAAIFAVGIVIFIGYPLNKNKANEVRQKLAERKAV